MKSDPQDESISLYGTLLALVLLVGGCSTPTESARDNRRLLDAILTAITMKNANWLEDDALVATKRHADGHLTDFEYEKLNSIIEKGRALEWQTAERLGYEFRQAHPFVKEGQ